MNLSLPPKIDGLPSVVLENVKQITVIGANGAGKTRFCQQIIKDCGDRAFIMSALRAIFPETRKNERNGSIDMLFDEADKGSPLFTSEANSEFEKVLFLLLHDEFLELLNFKAQAFDSDKVKLPVTKLDNVVRRWEEIFPKNKILREGGKLLFKSESGEDKYNSLRLSDGEKAVLYYLGCVQYACPNAVILIDDPGVFIHRSIMHVLWNAIEQMRPDCTFVYNTHDVDFAASRVDNTGIWVKSFDARKNAWDYEILDLDRGLSEEIYIDLLGSRKPVLFVEGDNTHSIDFKLYQLVFAEYTIKPLGSCNKVIESTRSFNDLAGFHHLDSHGIVDRDRRSEKEVEYLRNKKILVPDVAEVENIMLLPDIVKTVARRRKKDPTEVFYKVSQSIINMFKRECRQQALQHVRHRVKRDVEMHIDKRFSNINALEDHMMDLINEIRPRAMYEQLCRDFHEYIDKNDYLCVLRVFNQKSMLPACNVAGLCGFEKIEKYINYVLYLLKEDGSDAEIIRRAIRRNFRIPDTDKTESKQEKN